MRRGKFLYETRVLDSSYLRYKVQLPTSDSTEITAGGIKVRLEGLVLLDAPSGKIHLYLTRVAEKIIPKSTISQYLIAFLILTFQL